MIAGVVADDITGANDIGSMFAKAGCRVHVYSFPPAAPEARALDYALPDVCILDTNSRLDTRERAYEKVFAATRALQGAGCTRFFNKTCSVFRGNIGAEFDAMLDALGAEFAVVVLGFPKNGRTTVDGTHYVRGVPLEQSEFRRDPIHPMTRSDLVEILQAQTRRTVGLIDYRVIERGPETLRARLDRLRETCQYVILDVTGQPMLRTIASAVRGERVLCGSSALAEELPAVWEHAFARAFARAPLPQVAPQGGAGVLIVAGSLMPQTAAQIEHLRARGVPVLVLDAGADAGALFDAAQHEREVERLASALAAALREGHALLHAPNAPGAVAQVRAQGARRGLDATAAGRLVSETLAEVTARVVARSGQNRLVVAGGETSAGVCARLGVSGVRVGREIQPGLPLCISLGDPPRLLVLKSGSFGSAEFFDEAIGALCAHNLYSTSM